VSRILIHAAGTLGDHLPSIALGRALADRGHRVTLAINQAMHGWASRSGLAAVALPDIERGPEEARLNAWAWDHWNNSDPSAHPAARPVGEEELLAQARALADLCADADLLLSTSIRFLGLLAQRASGVPWLTFSLNPYAFWRPVDSGELAALCAGCPILVEPFGNDQLYNASRVSLLGAGAVVQPFATTAEGLASVLAEQVLSASAREKAAAVGARIGAERGIDSACFLIEAFLARPEREDPGRLLWYVPTLASNGAGTAVRGSAGSEEAARPAGPPAIPRVVHQSWRDAAVPDEVSGWRRSWREQNPGWEVRLWTDEQNRELISRDYAWFLPIYDGYAEPIMRADAARCFVLHRHGGVYADLDCACLRPLGPLLEGREIVLGLEPESHREQHFPSRGGLPLLVSNACMASVPGHPFWENLDPEVREAIARRAFVVHHWLGSWWRGAAACLLERQLLWWPQARRLAVSNRRLWEGSFVAEKAALGAYPQLRRGEDTPVLERLAAERRVVLLDAPRLYVYVFHGENTFGEEHWEEHWRSATETFEGSGYDNQAGMILKQFQREPAGGEAGASESRRPLSPPPTVLLLTPVKDAVAFLPRFLENVRGLAWPRDSGAGAQRTAFPGARRRGVGALGRCRCLALAPRPDRGAPGAGEADRRAALQARRHGRDLRSEHVQAQAGCRRPRDGPLAGRRDPAAAARRLQGLPLRPAGPRSRRGRRGRRHCAARARRPAPGGPHLPVGAVPQAHRDRRALLPGPRHGRRLLGPAAAGGLAPLNARSHVAERRTRGADGLSAMTRVCTRLHTARSDALACNQEDRYLKLLIMAADGALLEDPLTRIA